MKTRKRWIKNEQQYKPYETPSFIFRIHGKSLKGKKGINACTTYSHYTQKFQSQLRLLCDDNDNRMMNKKIFCKTIPGKDKLEAQNSFSKAYEKKTETDSKVYFCSSLLPTCLSKQFLWKIKQTKRRKKVLSRFCCIFPLNKMTTGQD